MFYHVLLTFVALMAGIACFGDDGDDYEEWAGKHSAVIAESYYAMPPHTMMHYPGIVPVWLGVEDESGKPMYLRMVIQDADANVINEGMLLAIEHGEGTSFLVQFTWYGADEALDTRARALHIEVTP